MRRGVSIAREPNKFGLVMLLPTCEQLANRTCRHKVIQSFALFLKSACFLKKANNSHRFLTTSEDKLTRTVFIFYSLTFFCNG